MSIKVNVVFPENLLNQLDRVANQKKRSAFIVKATQEHLRRALLEKSLKLTSGAWSSQKHPELKSGSVRWLRKFRKESTKREGL